VYKSYTSNAEKSCAPTQLRVSYGGSTMELAMTGWSLAACFLLAQSAADLYLRATRLVDQRDLDGARAAVEDALRLDPKLVPALVLKAKLAMQADRLADAEQALKAAIATEPAQRYPRFLLGMTYYLKNDFDRAATVLASADQSDARVVLYLAMTEEALNHTAAAIADYERALKLDPKGVDQRVAYARLLFTQGGLDRAEALIDEALQISPESPDALYEKGRCLFERGEFAQAAQAGERALARPESGAIERRVRYLLIRAYQKIGNAEMVAKHQAVFDRLPNPLVR
jgi:tetratricopeptide (TPR) repeat protein